MHHFFVGYSESSHLILDFGFIGVSSTVLSLLGPFIPELYAPPLKWRGGSVLGPRSPTQPDPDPLCWFRFIRFSSSWLVSKLLIGSKLAFLLHLEIVGRFHEGLNRVWYKPPGSALGFEEYPSLIVRPQLGLTYCQW